MTQLPEITENFNFWLPMEKAAKVVDPVTGKTVRRIRGVASTPDVDLQGEQISQTGLDFAYFLKHGYFNNDHKPGFSNKVGEPTTATIKNNQFWVEGFLYDNHKIANEIWDLMQAQESNPHAKRRIGFSVQGKIKRRNGTQIQKCWIQDVAITAAPINTNTWAEIAKSLSEEEWVDRGMSTQSASPMIKESLDSEARYQSHTEKNDASKSMSRTVAIWYLQLEKGLSRPAATRVVDAHCAGVI